MLVLQFYSLYYSTLEVDCFDFAYLGKNPVIADFTESQQTGWEKSVVL